MNLYRKRILITGGTGTLGRAIVIKSIKENWGTEFTIFSRSELRLSQMKLKFPNIKTVIGDVRDYSRLQSAVAGHDGVIHAAALKRIPECEESPRECFLTNVEGSENVARACYGRVEWVVGISTDKACQAITTYGASKLLTESIFLSWARRSTDGDTQYHLLRYGNVVASNGSVFPFWRGEYEVGNALPITDPGMSRFWMSPYDAVTSIERCLSDGRPGLIYVPRVKSMGIFDLARGFFPDCRFRVIGLRSSEKLHEDLISRHELSIEYRDYFLLGEGNLEKVYTSDSAPLLTIEEFKQMLRDAEEVEE